MYFDIDYMSCSFRIEISPLVSQGFDKVLNLFLDAILKVACRFTMLVKTF